MFKERQDIEFINSMAKSLKESGAPSLQVIVSIIGAIFCIVFLIPVVLDMTKKTDFAKEQLIRCRLSNEQYPDSCDSTTLINSLCLSGDLPEEECNINPLGVYGNVTPAENVEISSLGLHPDYKPNLYDVPRELWPVERRNIYKYSERPLRR